MMKGSNLDPLIRKIHPCFQNSNDLIFKFIQKGMLKKKSKLEIVREYMMKKVELFLYKEINPPPPLFFALFIYGHLGYTPPDAFTYTIFILGLLFAILYSYNHFYYYSPVLNSGIGYFSIANMIIGILAANQKWKLYLYLFIIGDSLTADYPATQQVYLMASSLFIAVECYRNFIFKSVDDNKIFFSGFFSIFLFYLFNYILSYIAPNAITKGEGYFILPFILFLSVKIILYRVKEIENSPTLIRDPELAHHYISLIQEYLKDENFREFYILDHRKKCTNEACFCRVKPPEKPQIQQEQPSQSLIEQVLPDDSNPARNYVEKIYEDFLTQNDWHATDREFLMNKYLEYQLKHKQYMRVICSYMKYIGIPGNYFRLVERYRLHESLEEKIKKDNYFDNYQHEYYTILHHDDKLTYLGKQIREILLEKVKFWAEVGKVNLKLNDIQRLSRDLVHRIESLHEFYSLEVKYAENILNNYDCSLVYAIYLLTSTNERQYSEGLIREISKNIQQYRGKEQLQIESMGMEINIDEYSQYGQSQKQSVKNRKLIIKNVSKNMCLLLNKHLTDMKGHDLTELIPSIFRPLHSIRCQEFFQDVEQLTFPYQLVASPLKLPFLVGENMIKMFQLRISFSHHIKDGLSIVCIFHEVIQERSANFMCLDKTAMFMESLEDKQVLESEEVSKLFQSLQTQWAENKQIFCRKPTIKGSKYLITASYQQLFLYYELTPVIELSRDTQNFRRPGQKKIQSYNAWKKQITKTTEGIINENSSESSLASRNDQVTNLLLVLERIQFIPLYRYLRIFFTILILVCLGVVYVVTFQHELQWSNTTVFENPISNLEDIRKIKITLNLVIGWQYDVIYTDTHQNAELTALIQRLNTEESFMEEAEDSFQTNFKLLREIITDDIIGISPIISEMVQNYLTGQHTVTNSASNSQDLSLRNLLMIYIIDVYTLSLHKSYDQTLLSLTYVEEICQTLDKLVRNIETKTNDFIDKFIIDEIIMVSFLALFLVLLIAPLWKFNQMKKEKHEEVFDLLTSIESSMVFNETKKLVKLEKQVVNKRKIDEMITADMREEIQLGREDKPRQREYSELLDAGQVGGNPLDSLLGLKNIAMGNVEQQLIRLGEEVIATEIGQLRKRNGELDVTGSESDPKKFVCSNWILTSFILIHVLVVIALFVLKISFLEEVKAHNNISIQSLVQIQFESLVVMNTKIYFDEYSLDNKLKFNGTDLEKWIEDELIEHSQLHQSQIYSSRIKQCLSNQLLCSQDYTEIMIKGMIVSIVSNAFHHKKMLLQASNATQYESKNDQIRFTLYFAQQLCDKSEEMEYRGLALNMHDLGQIQEKFKEERLLVFISGLVLTVLSFIGGCCYIDSAQNKYIKDVTLLTFLNPEMIRKNKRVGSFIERLEKNTH